MEWTSDFQHQVGGQQQNTAQTAEIPAPLPVFMLIITFGHGLDVSIPQKVLAEDPGHCLWDLVLLFMQRLQCS